MWAPEPRSHSHLAALRAQEHIIISGSVLSTHGSSKIVEPSMIVVDLEEMERNMLKEDEELKISGGMKINQVRAISHTPEGTKFLIKSFICTCIAACRLAVMALYFMFYFMFSYFSYF